MKNYLRIGGLALVLTFCFGFKGCSEDDQKNFRRGVSIGAAAATEVHRTTQDFCRAEIITAESCEKTLPRTENVARIADSLNQFVDAHPNLTPETRPEVLAFVDDILGELDLLAFEGVQFKDQKKQQVYLISLTAARATVRSLRVSIDK